MKKLLITLLITLFVSSLSLYAQQGQGNGQGKGQGKNKEQKDKDKDNKKEKDKSTVPSEVQNDNNDHGKGHAYGKNKDSLEGRDFGQHRAAEARSKNDAVQNSEANITDVSNTNQNTLDKIKEAREKLIEKKNNKQISEAEYNRNINELNALENQVNQNEEKNKTAKEKLNKTK